MKKSIVRIAFTLIIALVLNACTAPRNFSDLSDTKGVTMVYTSSALFKLTGGIASKITGVDLKDVMKHVASVRVIIAENGSASKKAQSVVRYQIAQMHAMPIFEKIGQVTPKRNNGSGIYVTSTSANTFNNIVVVIDSGFKYQAIFLEGQFTLSDIESLGL